MGSERGGDQARRSSGAALVQCSQHSGEVHAASWLSFLPLCSVTIHSQHLSCSSSPRSLALPCNSLPAASSSKRGGGCPGPVGTCWPAASRASSQWLGGENIRTCSFDRKRRFGRYPSNLFKYNFSSNDCIIHRLCLETPDVTVTVHQDPEEACVVNIIIINTICTLIVV